MLTHSLQCPHFGFSAVSSTDTVHTNVHIVDPLKTDDIFRNVSSRKSLAGVNIMPLYFRAKWCGMMEVTLTLPLKLPSTTKMIQTWW
jgi:hypothetical protein